MKFKIGKAYYVRFDDHLKGDHKGLADSQILGWCVEDTPEYVKMTWWLCISEDTEMVKDNLEPFTIGKAMIKKKKLLTLPT